MQLIKGDSSELVLERCDADLRFLVQQGFVFTEHMQILILLQLLDAVMYLHKCNVIHCDIKPSNVLVNFDMNGNVLVKLCDFGLSQIGPQAY